MGLIKFNRLSSLLLRRALPKVHNFNNDFAKKEHFDTLVMLRCCTSCGTFQHALTSTRCTEEHFKRLVMLRCYTFYDGNFQNTFALCKT